MAVHAFARHGFVIPPSGQLPGHHVHISFDNGPVSSRLRMPPPESGAWNMIAPLICSLQQIASRSPSPALPRLERRGLVLAGPSCAREEWPIMVFRTCMWR